MTLLEVYKYGIGMLGMTLVEVLDMEVVDFIPLVEGNLLMEDERMENLADTLMPFHAKNTAMVVGSSGNMGKNFDHMEMARMLYPKEEVWGTQINSDKEGTYEDKRDSLMTTFNIDKKDIDKKDLE